MFRWKGNEFISKFISILQEIKFYQCVEKYKSYIIFYKILLKIQYFSIRKSLSNEASIKFERNSICLEEKNEKNR